CATLAPHYYGSTFYAPFDYW
nr:immunoglobulin heavy chain junction region [Macaca mulatta]